MVLSDIYDLQLPKPMRKSTCTTRARDAANPREETFMMKNKLSDATGNC